MAKEKWITADGQEVPAQFVPTIDKKKHRMVQKYISKASKLQEQMEAFKAALLTTADELYEEMENDANVRTGTKGNYTLQTFDKSMRIEVNVQERVEFGDEINLAQQKLKEYLDVKLQGRDADLSQLVHHAFETRKGQLDVKRVLGLKRLKINHPIWKEAMELIDKSIDRNFSKRYVRMYQRDEEGNYRPVELNFSSI